MSRWTHGLIVIKQKILLGICPGKVFFCLQIAVADTLKIWCN
nr:MAG TPA: hypothetical protein [Caudoviricetes sp.]